MKKPIIALIVLAAVCMIVAALSGLINVAFFGIAAEGYSNACTNLALLAIALLLYSKKEG